jgi:hypothetical protein
MLMTNPDPLNTKELKTPASKARVAFVANSADMRSYLVLHQLALKRPEKSLRRHSYILDKAVYVLIASLWEAYCEDIVTESLDYIAAHAPSCRALPSGLVSEIEKNIRSGKDSPWELAGEGWREYIKKRREGFEKKRNRDFTGPKSRSVEEFFYNVLGIEELCDSWRAAGPPNICEDLDAHLDRRNSLVHRITPGRVVEKADVKNFFRLVWNLAMYTDDVVDDMLTKVTGKSRWKGHVNAGDSGAGPVGLEDALAATVPATRFTAA